MWRYFLINWCCKTRPICFFLKKKKETKQNKTTTKKRKQFSPRSRTQDLRRGRGTHYPLRHATIAKAVSQINCIWHFCAHKINYSRWRRKCRRMTKWVPQKVTLEHQRSPKIRCCVLLKSNAINRWSYWAPVSKRTGIRFGFETVS